MTSLVSSPCRQICVWGPTEEHIGAMALFRCRGCGSEWTRDQPWRPADSDGKVPASVLSELKRAGGQP